MRKKQSFELSRRHFLRGAGACVALPFLSSLSGRASAQSPVPVQRFIAFYLPNGMHMQAWIPQTTGPDYELPPILSGFSALKNDIMVLSGLSAHPGQSEGGGDHASGTGAYLTATHVKKSLTELVAGISVDQVLANQQSARTPFRSLQLGIEGGGNEGNCDGPGYACAYMRNISWASPSQPLPKIISPRVFFDLLFPATGPRSPLENKRRRSVLDFVAGQARELEPRLSRADRAKLDEYLTGVRELEIRIDHDSASCSAALPRPEAQVDIPTRVRLMLDLMIQAVQCDSSRILTFMMGNGGSYRSYGFIGVPEGHHDLSHHMGNPDIQAKIQKINTWEMDQIAYFLGRLKALPEGAGSVLDNTTFYVSSEITDGNAHDHVDIPVLVAGRAGGRMVSGSHRRYNGEPVANLFKTFLSAHGIQVETFGDDGHALLPGILASQ